MQITVPATFSGTFTGTLTIDVPDQPGQQPPLGFWGGYRPPYVDIGFPGPQPPPGQPTHPIYWPPSIWPSPGHPAHPIAPGGPPPTPTHPIYWPPYVDIGPPGPQPPPLGFWGGYRPPYVDIGFPGPQPPGSQPQPPDGGTPGPGGNFSWQYRPAWDPSNGWHTVVIGVPAPDSDKPIVTPSEEPAPTP